VAVTAPAASGVKKRRKPSPFLGGILPFDSSRIPLDVAAGATLAALAIPEVMGYTKIAGTPVVTGLYTLLLPVLFFALFGSSRHLVVGADSATAAILAIGLAGMAAADSTEYVALASLAALMCGLLLFAARLLRLGFISNFLSRSVLVGFLTGVGIQVAMGQVAGIFGVPKGSGSTVESFVGTLQNIAAGMTSWPTFVVAASVLIVVVGLERVNKKIPGALIAVVGAIVASYALDLAAQGVTTLGPVPGGLPPIGLPTSVMTLENVQALLPTVISLFIVILAQSAATSQAYAARYGDSFDENVDLIGLGMANIGAGISGTFVVNGSPTKTEMVDSAGGRSQVAQLTAGVIVLAVILFLTGPLSYMPNAVLAAVVFLIGLRLVDYKHMAVILRLRPGEFAVAAITAATVVIVGVEQGIFLAIGLSIIEQMLHTYRPYNALLRVKPSGGFDYAAVEEHVEAAPGLVVYQFGAGLYYANTSGFNEQVLGLIDEADPPVKWFCIAGGALADVDYTGAEALRSLARELKERGAALVMCRITPKVRAELDAYGLTAEIGEDRIFEDADAVLEAYKALAPAA
jgi:sulfate permease, SulP family